MHTGMLWFDNDPATTLIAKIQKAASYYKKRLDNTPDLCLLHPNMMEKGQTTLTVDNITVRAYRPVSEGHLWIGTEEVDPDIVKAQARLKP